MRRWQRNTRTLIVDTLRSSLSAIRRYGSRSISTMVSRQADNVIMAGRMLSTDRSAFGAIRVMVNLNQVGEAAGVTASLAASDGMAVSKVDAASVRDKLSELGAVIV